MPGQRILIFANGELPDYARARTLLLPQDVIYCADGGARHALALGLLPALVIGDMDSLGKEHWKQLEQAGVQFELYPRDKDETDLELALRRALEMKPESILILGLLGGRLDQTLGNLSLLSDPALADLELRADDGVEEVIFCRSQVQIKGQSGDLVSLLPWGGAVAGIHTQGLKWALSDETLYPHKTRGVSNQMLGEAASVSIRSGLLLIVHRRQ